MINGAHVVIFSSDAEADRGFFRDVLGLNHVDVGEGWLIFALPPAEAAVHPAEENNRHELYLLCADVEDFIAGMRSRGVECGAIDEQAWGRQTQVTLPGGGRIGVYEPRHARPGG